MNNIAQNKELRDFLADSYYSLGQTREIWERAGGNPARISDQAESRVRWTELLKMSHNGAVPPLRLLKEVLSDYPANPVVLRAIREQVSEASLERAKTMISTTLKPEPIDIDFTELNNPEGELLPALTVQLAEKTPEEQKSFIATFKEKAAEALANALMTGAIKFLEYQFVGG